MKNILAIILGVCASIIVALFFMPHTEEVPTTTVMNEINTKAIQVGVFQNENKAITEANNIGARVIKENNYYYLYFSILKDMENINKITAYLASKGIKNFIKVVSISSEFENNLIQYEEMMKKTTSTIALLELNKRIMDLYEGTYAN